MGEDGVGTTAVRRTEVVKARVGVLSTGSVAFSHCMGNTVLRVAVQAEDREALTGKLHYDLIIIIIIEGLSLLTMT